MMDWEGEELAPVNFVMASVLSSWLPGAVEKPWLDLCGPASIGKSEILRILEDGGRRTITMDHPTENAFASSMQDKDDPEKDYSLLYRLTMKSPPYGPKVLVITEFSTILNLSNDRAMKFFSNVRQAHSGRYSISSGNQGLKTWTNIRFSLLTAGTEKLDEFRKVNQTLGERTLICRIGRHLTEYEARQEAIDNETKLGRIEATGLRAHCKVTASKAIDKAITTVKASRGHVAQDEQLLFKVGRLGAIASSVRSSPVSGKTYASLAEGPFRIKRQFAALGDSHVLCDARTSWTDSDYQMVRRIAQDTMPQEYLKAIRALWRGSVEASTKPMTVSEILDKAKITGDFYRQLNQWAIIGILRKEGDDLYSLNPSFAKDLELTDFMEGLDGL